jgi:hypothetical protein
VFDGGGVWGYPGGYLGGVGGVVGGVVCSPCVAASGGGGVVRVGSRECWVKMWGDGASLRMAAG